MNRRAQSLLAACLTGLVIGSFGFGTPVASLAFLVPTALLLVHLLVARRRRSTPEMGWSGSATEPTLRGERGTARQVAAALGRVEARELSLSPWFSAGLGLLAVIYVVLAIVYSSDNGEVWSEVAGLAPWFAHPLAGMTIVATHRAVTRPQRDGTDELFDTCPAPPVTRVAGVLRSAVVPLVAFTVFLAIYWGTVFVRSPDLHGPIEAEGIAHVLASLVLLVGAVGLGVLLGSWLRFGLVPVVAVVAVGLVSLGLATSGDPGWNGLSTLSTFGPQVDSPLLQPLVSVWWYAAWMAALSALVAVGAMLRHRRDRPMWVVAVGLVTVAMASALMATRPIGGDAAAEVASHISDPGDHQRCQPVDADLLQVCTYDGYHELRDRLVAGLVPLAAVLPPDLPPVTIRQGFEGDPAELPPAVRSRLRDVPAVGDREVRVGFAAADDAVSAAVLRVAFLTLGLDTQRIEGPVPRSIAGEARGVVALWLAARNLDADAAARLASYQGSGADAFERGLAWPGGCGPVVWSPQDLAAARAVLALPAAEVQAVIAGDLARWSSPAASTDDLLAVLGLASQGPPEPMELRVEDWCDG